MNTVTILPVFSPIVLTKEDDDDEMRLNANWGCIERLERNALRVSLAGGLSVIGGVVAGFSPTFGGILAGGAIGGIGNGASTWLAWENPDQYFIEARLVEDFPKLLERSQVINQYLDQVIDKMQNIYSVTINLPEVPPTEDPEEDTSFCTFNRHHRNCIRLCTAGSLSAAGGWLGGFVPTTAGIIGGAVLGGIGNGVSTLLAYEQTNEAKIQRAVEAIPRLLKELNECGTKLNDLVEEIKALNLECLLFDDLRPQETEVEEGFNCGRYMRNFAYVNLAGWMSAAGGWMGGYWPTPAGIVIGGGLASAANAISTWLAWEKPNDKEVEKAAVKGLPELIFNINQISQKLIALSTLTKACKDLKEPVLQDLPSIVVEI